MQRHNGRRQQLKARLGLVRNLTNLALGAVAVVLRLFNALRPRGTCQSNRTSIFIIEPFGLGDIISLAPFIHELLAHDCDLRVCAREEWRILYPNEAIWVSAAIPWANHATRMKYRLADYLSRNFREVLRALRGAGKGCIGVDVRGDIRSVILLHLAGCRPVISLSHYLDTDLVTLPGSAIRIPFDPTKRRWESNWSFLHALPLPQPKMKPAPPFFPHLAALAAPTRPRSLAFMAVAPWVGKCWIPSRWSELAELLRSNGWEVLGLCGPGQTSMARQQLGESVSIRECHSVEEWARAFGGVQGVVTLDSGPMHLADALGVPVVALFGQGALPLWAPSSERSTVVTHQTDSDFVAFQPVDANTELGRKFMSRITVAEVLAGLERVGLLIGHPAACSSPG